MIEPFRNAANKLKAEVDEEEEYFALTDSGKKSCGGCQFGVVEILYNIYSLLLKVCFQIFAKILMDFVGKGNLRQFARENERGRERENVKRLIDEKSMENLEKMFFLKNVDKK